MWKLHLKIASNNFIFQTRVNVAKRMVCAVVHCAQKKIHHIKQKKNGFNFHVVKIHSSIDKQHECLRLELILTFKTYLTIIFIPIHMNT